MAVATAEVTSIEAALTDARRSIGEAEAERQRLAAEGPPAHRKKDLLDKVGGRVVLEGGGGLGDAETRCDRDGQGRAEFAHRSWACQGPLCFLPQHCCCPVAHHNSAAPLKQVNKEAEHRERLQELQQRVAAGQERIISGERAIDDLPACLHDCLIPD